MAGQDDTRGQRPPQQSGASRSYSEQGSGWFGHESGGGSEDRSRNASQPGAYGAQGTSASDRVGQFGDERRGYSGGGYMGGREGGSGGRAGFMHGGNDQTGNWQGARYGQGERERNYGQESYDHRRTEHGTTGSRDAPAQYQHQGGLGVTAGPYGHRGEGEYGESRRDEGGYGRDRTPGQRSQPGYGSTDYGYGGGQPREPRFGGVSSSGYGEHNQGAYGPDDGRHGGEQYAPGQRQDRDWRGGDRSRSGSARGGETRTDYGPQYGRGGGYGGGEEWRDRHPQQEQFDRDRSSFSRYGQGEGQRGDGGQDRGPAPRQGEQRWGEAQERYSRGAFGSGSSTYGMGSSYAQQGEVAGGASPFGPGSGSGIGGASYGAARGPGLPQHSSGSMQRRGPKNYQRTDERLREVISERLVDDPHIDSSDVDVHVKDGEVRLEGTVHDRRTKYEIEELVEHIHGVRDIDNRLKVRRGGLLAGLFGGGHGHAQHGHDHHGSESREALDRATENSGYIYRERGSETERAGQEQDRWQQRSGSTADALESLKSGTHAGAAGGSPSADAQSSGTHASTTHGSPLMAGTADLRNASTAGGSSATPLEPTAPPNQGTAGGTGTQVGSGTSSGAAGTTPTGTGTAAGATTPTGSASGERSASDRAAARGGTGSGAVGVDRGSAEKSSGETRPGRRTN